MKIEGHAWAIEIETADADREVIESLARMAKDGARHPFPMRRRRSQAPDPIAEPTLEQLRGETSGWWRLSQARLTVGRVSPCKRCGAEFRALGLMGFGVNGPADKIHWVDRTEHTEVEVIACRMRAHPHEDPAGQWRDQVIALLREQRIPVGSGIAHLVRQTSGTREGEIWVNACPACGATHSEWDLTRPGRQAMVPQTAWSTSDHEDHPDEVLGFWIEGPASFCGTVMLMTDCMLAGCTDRAVMDGYPKGRYTRNPSTIRRENDSIMRIWERLRQARAASANEPAEG